jgi:uncharacterized membrane protein
MTTDHAGPAIAPRPSTRLDRAFHVGLVLKALDGVLETIGGFILLFVSPASINHFVRWATAHELAQDPHDFVARHLLHSASMLTTSSTLYGAVYLLLHGVTKLVLIVFVLKDKLWAYPWLIALLGVFIAYQSYRLTQKASFGLAALTAFDVVVTWLTWREYQVKLRARAWRQANAGATSSG